MTENAKTTQGKLPCVTRLENGKVLLNPTPIINNFKHYTSVCNAILHAEMNNVIYQGKEEVFNLFFSDIDPSNNLEQCSEDVLVAVTFLNNVYGTGKQEKHIQK